MIAVVLVGLVSIPLAVRLARLRTLEKRREAIESSVRGPTIR